MSVKHRWMSVTIFPHRHLLRLIFLNEIPPPRLCSPYHREDAQAPKRVSWAKSNTGSDVASKNGTLSSIATSPRPRDPHQANFHYPYSPTSASDTGSVINAYQLRPGEAGTLQGLPGYNAGGTPSRKHKRPSSANGGPPQLHRTPAVAVPIRTEGAQPQVPPPSSQAGSLV